MRHLLFEDVRDRFQLTCGYCGVTEITVGGELTIDHLLEQQNAELQKTISAQEGYLELLKEQTTKRKPPA